MGFPLPSNSWVENFQKNIILEKIPKNFTKSLSIRKIAQVEKSMKFFCENIWKGYIFELW